jgi:hypothetical protein
MCGGLVRGRSTIGGGGKGDGHGWLKRRGGVAGGMEVANLSSPEMFDGRAL